MSGANASRLDRLFLLLDTGSNATVRSTAAQLIGDSAKKKVNNRKDWIKLLNRVLPYIRSSSWDTRIAAGQALKAIASNTPEWTPTYPPEDDSDLAFEEKSAREDAEHFLTLQTLDLEQVLANGKFLLGSAGKEYDLDLSALNKNELVSRQRKGLTSRLGIGSEFMDSDLIADGDLVSGGKGGHGVAAPESEVASATSAQDALAGLSARERNKMKRKLKMAGRRSSSMAMEGIQQASSETNGVHVDGDTANDQHYEDALESTWPFESFSDALSILLVEPSWETRHGAAIGLREILKSHGQGAGRKQGLSSQADEKRHQLWLQDIAVRLLCVFALDRFGDFVGDQVVAPVREMCAQALGAVLKHLTPDSVISIKDRLLQLLNASQETVASNSDSKIATKTPRSGLWQVKHAGLLGLKYLMAVRNDLVDTLLPSVYPAIVASMEDDDDDVRAVACECLLPIAAEFVRLLPHQCVPMIQVLWQGLIATDDITASTATIMDLLSKLSEFPQILANLVGTRDCSTSPGDLAIEWKDVVPSLYACFRHASAVVRRSVLGVMKALLVASDRQQADLSWLNADFLQVVFQNFVLEETEEVIKMTSDLWAIATAFAIKTGGAGRVITPQLARVFFALIMTPIGTPLSQDLLVFHGGYGETSDSNAKGSKAKRRRRKATRPDANPQHDIRVESQYEASGLNLDSVMIQQDLGVLRLTDIIRGRMAGADALGLMMSEIMYSESKMQPIEVEIAPGHVLRFTGLIGGVLKEYLVSTFASQRHLAALALERSLLAIYEEEPVSASGLDLGHLKSHGNQVALSLRRGALSLLDSSTHSGTDALEASVVYDEVVSRREAIRNATNNLLLKFGSLGISTQAFENMMQKEYTSQGERDVCAGREISTKIFESWFVEAKKRGKKSAGELQELRNIVKTTLDEHDAVLKMYEIRVMAALAASVVASTDLPPKLNPIIRSLMNSIRCEENTDIQCRSAIALCRFIALDTTRPANDKVLKNTCAFACSDTEATPLVSKPGGKDLKGILTLKLLLKEQEAEAQKSSNGAQSTEPPPKGKTKKGTESKKAAESKKEKASKASDADAQGNAHQEQEKRAAFLVRRGATMVLRELAIRFKDDLYHKAPKLWQCIDGPIRALESASEEDAKALQDAVDALYVLEVMAGFVSTGLRPQMATMLPYVIELGLKSQYSVLRYMGARALASLCKVATTKAMLAMVETVLPLLGDALNLTYRQGSAEALHHVVECMGTDILPYIVFFIVPVLGRMSDVDLDVRRSVTSAFATLVKLIPLEEGIPDPPDMPAYLLEQRQEERRFLSQLFDIKKLDDFQIPVKIYAELRKYQQDGVNWLAFLDRYKLHGILCDDMGLGKTLQTICILASSHHIRREEFRKTNKPEFARCPSIVVCPSTLTGHWCEEIEKYTDSLRPLCYTGAPGERSAILSRLGSIDVLVMSYEVLRNDIDSLKGIQWNYAVLDEGHIIRNRKTKITLASKAIKAMHRLILSGTPIQNNILELWSLFDFLMPGFLGTERQFNEMYSKPVMRSRDAKKSSKEQEQGQFALDALHRQVLPFLLRRLKEEVLDDLPPKIIQDHYCDLSPVQLKLYERFSKLQVGEIKQEVTGGAEGETKKPVHVFNALQYLRKLCNHPLLVLNPKTPDYSSICRELKLSAESLRSVSSAPKLLALRQLLMTCGIGVSDSDQGSSGGIDEGTVSQHRALIFCQLKTMIDIIESDLFSKMMPSVSYLRLDGSVEASKRQGIVTKFNDDPSVDVLLLTTQVGGLGLNLTSADTVIFVEHDWNPMKDLQAMDRAHRLGQKKVVNVYRLITRGTLEEKIMGLQKFKMNIASQVVNQQNSRLSTMNSDQILDLFAVGGEAPGAAGQKRGGSEDSGSGSQKRRKTAGPGLGAGAVVLENMEELWDENQYEDEHDLANFVADL